MMFINTKLLAGIVLATFFAAAPFLKAETDEPKRLLKALYTDSGAPITSCFKEADVVDFLKKNPHIVISAWSNSLNVGDIYQFFDEQRKSVTWFMRPRHLEVMCIMARGVVVREHLAQNDDERN